MIKFTNVSKAFGEQQILRDVTFSIGTGEHVGIVGPNGVGKSTLFGLLVDDMSSDAGSIEVPKNSRIGYLHQQLNADGHEGSLLEFAESGVSEIAAIQHDMDGVESELYGGDADEATKKELLEKMGELQTRFENLNGYTVKNRAEAALHGLGFTTEDFKKPLKDFSGGWQLRAELVSVLIGDPEILLLDEPSNYLDVPAVEWLQKFLRNFSGTMVLISHDRYLLNSLTNVTMELSHGDITRYPGNYDYYAKERVERYEQRISAHKNQQKMIDQTKQFIDRFRSKNTKAAAVQSKIKMLEKIEIIELPQQMASKGMIKLPEPERTGQEVVRLENAGMTYDGSQWVLRDVDLRIERGQKIALVGLNGYGKTTLLRMLADQLQPSEGKRFLGHKVVIGYQSQEFAETMSASLTVLETVKNVDRTVSEQEARSLLGGFGFTGNDVDKKVQVLSGGEKVRLAFARLLVNPPNFLLLDEPTTHLDISAREVLENALKDFKGTLCFVSHDIEFVRNVADTIIAMAPPGITRHFGGYDYYLEKINAKTPIEAAVKSSNPSAKQQNRRDRAEVVQKYSKVRREIQKEINKLEKKISEFEATQADLLEKLSVEGADYKELNKSLKDVQQKLNDYTMRWEAFAIELDELDQEYASKRKN